MQYVSLIYTHNEEESYNHKEFKGNDFLGKIFLKCGVKSTHTYRF